LRARSSLPGEYASNSGAHHLVMPEPGGSDAAHVMATALKDAGLSRVDYIKDERSTKISAQYDIVVGRPDGCRRFVEIKREDQRHGSTGKTKVFYLMTELSRPICSTGNIAPIKRSS